MRIPRGPGALGLALLLAAWLAAAAGVKQSSIPLNVRPAVGVVSPAPDFLVLEIAAQADRLADRLRTPPAPVEPLRNPFTFEEPPRTPRGDRAGEEPPAQAVPEPEATRPPLQLIGIAEEEQETGIIRTAVLSGPGGPYLVKEGEGVADGYRVTRIGRDAVELAAESGDGALTLTLP